MAILNYHNEFMILRMYTVLWEVLFLNPKTIRGECIAFGFMFFLFLWFCPSFQFLNVMCFKIGIVFGNKKIKLKFEFV